MSINKGKRKIPLIIWCETIEELTLIEKQTDSDFGGGMMTFPCVYFLNKLENRNGGCFYEYDLYEYSTQFYVDVFSFKEKRYNVMAKDYNLVKLRPYEISEKYPEYCI